MSTVEMPEMQAKGLAWLARFAEKMLPEARIYSEPTYGFFHGGDPRNFTPDPECSTDMERTRHREDCAKWEQAQRDGIGEPDCRSLFDAIGKLQVIVTRAQYGLGTNCDSELQELVFYVEQALDLFNPWRAVVRGVERGAERIVRSLGLFW